MVVMMVSKKAEMMDKYLVEMMVALMVDM